MATQVVIIVFSYCFKIYSICYNILSIKNTAIMKYINLILKSSLSSIFLMLLMTSCTHSQSDDEIYSVIKNEQARTEVKNHNFKSNRWNISSSDGNVLYKIIEEKGYTRGLEVGTSNGYSGMWIGAALKDNGGKLITIEINEQRANEAKANFKKAGLNSDITVIINDAAKAIPKLEGKFDFVFLDADKSGYIDYLKMIKPMMKKGGVITAHNTESHASGMREFLEAIKSDPDLKTTFHRQGSGISISYVK